MKNTKRLFGLLAAMAIVIFLAPSCKKGNTGPAGAAGATGAIGTQGTAGLDGNTLLNGDGAPSADLGANGDFYLDITAMAIYGPKTGSGWGSPVALKGASGEAGADAQVLVDTFTITNDGWSGRGSYYHGVQNEPNGGNAFPGMYVTRYNYAITESILATGLVMVSYRSTPDYEETENRWSPLPYTFYGPGFNYNLDFTTDLNKVTVDFFLTRSPSFSTNPFQEDMVGVTLPAYQVKVAVIPASAVIQIGSVMKERKAGSVSAN